MLTRHQSRVALGSKVDLVLVSAATEIVVAEAFRQLWLAIFEFEKRCSRFLLASELSQFNRGAGLKRPVSPEFRSVLDAARRMARLCNNLYNPFVLPALQRAGYVRSMVAAHQGDEVDNFSDRSVGSPDQLEIGPDWARIPYGTAIDLGGCGKGFAADMLADLADSLPDISGYWFSLGGDIVAGGLDEADKPWVVGIEAVPAKHGALAARVELPGPERYAVATSSTLRRTGTKQGKTWHHIIDPRTGQPARSTMATASVCSRTALIADVLASCAIIVEAKRSEAYLAERGALGAVLQTKRGKIISWGDDITVDTHP